jgi:hypothetical protein
MVNMPYITRCGLPGIEHVPFGMHACQFYRNRNELVAAMVPYFVAGLRENERCLWITAPLLPAHEAPQALRAASDGVDEAIQAGALHILDFDQWYGSLGRLKGLDVIQFWLEEEERRSPKATTAFASPGIRASLRRATGRRSWSTNRP